MTTSEAQAREALAEATSSSALRAYLALLLGVTCIGFSAIFTRWAEAPGVVVAAWRVGVATAALALPFARQPAPRRQLSRSMLGWAILGGALFALDVGVWSASLDYTTAANATFMANTAPLWVGLLTLFLLHKPLPRLFWPSIALALSGAAVMIFSNVESVAVRQGDLMALLASFFWAGYQLVTARARSQMSNLSYLWLMVFTSTALLVPFSLLRGYALVGYSPQTTLAMLGAGLVSQVGGYLGINYALGHLTAARVSVTILLQPVITAVAAFILLGEPFGGWRLVGGALILAGVYLVTVPSRGNGQRRE